MATPTEVVKKVLGKTETPEIKIDPKVEERVKRGQARLKEVTPRRKEAIAFANNEHYVSVAKGELQRLDTVPMALGGKKPDHRVRLSRDLIGPIVKGKVSATTQRIPGYESIATSPDAEDFSAARLSEKIATGGYELWQVKRHSKKLVWNALVTEEAFIRAYWDSTVGPFIEVPNAETEEPEHVGMGEVGIRVYGGTQVSWEPGVDFEDSRWLVIEEARPTEDVEAEPDFQGKKLNPDAEASDLPKERKGSKLVMVTEYLERPCPSYPEGRRLIMANGRVLFPEEPYPLRNAKGQVVDEPCLHRLTYDLDDSSDRGKGLVRALIESMRQYDQGANKVLEWVQLMLAPQYDAEEGTMLTPLTDEPGAVNEYAPLAGGNPPKPRQVPTIPRELFEIQDRAQREMEFISHDGEVAAQKAESGKQAQTLLQKAQLAWQDFIEDYAEVQARLMRDCLTLVQLHYTEDRLVKFRGRTGWESIADFKGADIRNQTDIRVPPSSLEPRTRATNEQRIMNIAQMFPGHFPPEVLISALEGGSAEKLIEGYEDDVARANRIISLIRSGQFWNVPMRPVFPGEEAPAIDPETGMVETDELGRPQMLTELPGWMPRPFDNVPVQKTVLETWMKTDDWANLDEASQRATMDVYDALLKLEAQKAQRDAEMQSQMAETAGMSNAAKPPPSKQMPSQPALSGEEQPA
jgi:hypothetical protein